MGTHTGSAAASILSLAGSGSRITTYLFVFIFTVPFLFLCVLQTVLAPKMDLCEPPLTKPGIPLFVGHIINLITKKLFFDHL
jgi:hypothetical protein